MGVIVAGVERQSVTAGIPPLDVSRAAHVEMSYIGGTGLKLGMSGCSLGHKDFFHLGCALLFARV